jgi:hypothetical protein
MFYSNINNDFTSGPYVQFPDGEFLHLDLLDTYTFPVRGWYYFSTVEEAKEFFGITE